jgi:hypothetical protein
MLSGDVSQHFLTEAADGQDRGVAFVPPFKEDLHQVKDGFDGESAHVLVPRDLRGEAGPGLVQLSLDVLVRRPADGAPQRAARRASPVGQVLAGTDHGQMFGLQVHAGVTAPGEREAMRVSDKVRVLAARRPVLPERLLGNHLLVGGAVLARPQARASKGSALRRREVRLEAAGRHPSSRAHSPHELGEGRAGAQLGGHKGGRGDELVVGHDHRLVCHRQ